MLMSWLLAPLLIPTHLFILLRLRASCLFAHCDGMDGPVVKAAQRALETADARPILMWVQPDDEPEITRAFRETREVRTLSSQVREIADRHFFETLVRVHRAGEGAAFTGLKPAGRDLGPAIPAADRALEEGSVEPLVQLLSEAMAHGVRHRFEGAMRKHSYPPDDVEAGRSYVQAYVEFIHYVERLYRAATDETSGHHHDEM